MSASTNALSSRRSASPLRTPERQVRQRSTPGAPQQVMRPRSRTRSNLYSNDFEIDSDSEEEGFLTIADASRATDQETQAQNQDTGTRDSGENEETAAKKIKNEDLPSGSLRQDTAGTHSTALSLQTPLQPLLGSDSHNHNNVKDRSGGSALYRYYTRNYAAIRYGRPQRPLANNQITNHGLVQQLLNILRPLSSHQAANGQPRALLFAWDSLQDQQDRLQITTREAVLPLGTLGPFSSTDQDIDEKVEAWDADEEGKP